MSLNDVDGRSPLKLNELIPNAQPELCTILDGDRGPVQPPIRAEIFGSQRFAQHGRSLGLAHSAVKVGASAASFFPRLRSNIDSLREAHRYIGLQASTGYDISPAAEWLLDNFHLIEAQLKEIHEGLPRSYFRALPMLQDEPLAGLPRVYGIAWAFVAHTDGAFDEELLIQFLVAYQETRELNLSEIWALPTTLRVVLVENLRRLSERVATNKAAREVANLCCDKIENYSLQALDQLLTLLNQRGVGHVFLAQMAQRLRDRNTHPHPNDRVDYLGWLQMALPHLAAVQTQQPANQAADNLSVSNAVMSLRAVGDADWPDIVCRTSTLMRLMLTSEVFEAEDISTRDQTLHEIERLARRASCSEVAVASALLGLMPQTESRRSDHDAKESVASYWLIGDGLPALVQALGLASGMAFRWHKALKRLTLPAYLAAVVLATLGLVVWLMPNAALGPTLPHFFTPGWLMVLGVAFMMFPASETAVAVIHRVISESVKPKHLPRLSLGLGIPPEHRVLVVMPAMLTSARSAPALARRLLLHYLANPETQAQFALLTDWADADAAQLPGDDAMLSSALGEIQALNALHPNHKDIAPRFILLHRKRTYSTTEQCWMGWERKRGKLELLISALATGSPGDFLDLKESSRLADNTRYVLTLDSDTQLPPGRLRELVGVAAHPSNQPQLDAAGRTVVSGYGILQPRIVTPLPAAKDFTLFHWLFAGHCGIDPYSAATSEVYQDVFGEGSFTGKGLLHVQALHAVLGNRLPEGQVLSHDLLEGSMARCAAVTDVTLIEDSPFHADVAASRVHRWTRGDWQLLPFLLQPGRYPMRIINRWKMLDNLRRSLVAPMSLALLLLTLAGYVMSPWTALGLVVAAFSAGPLMGAVVGFAPSRDDLAKLNFYRQAGIDLARVVWGGLWHVSQLLQQATLAVDAIVRALHRMGVSHRHMLQWTTAEAAQAQATSSLRATWQRHWRLTVTALLGLMAFLWAPSPVLALAVSLCLLWAASPVGTWWVSRPSRSFEGLATGSKDRAYLESIARDTWRLFERCVVADDRFLPPDNLQVMPHDMVAHRTSPTNIGLYLLSACCARQFGWIDTQDLLTRLEATVTSMGTLERHRGHFLNWYDTQTGTPLLPQYVSTVDSGNLCGHLLAVAQACRELASVPQGDQDPSTTARLMAVAQTCEAIANEADFSFLYNSKRHLLHIGYRVFEQQLDASYYDLLASESRLTSLFAIAKGDVPVRHWSALGRPFYAVGARAALRSWSGSMFEYLMPSLVLDEPPGSALHGACHAAILEQMAFAKPQDVPWGISESAYAASDHTLAYQYAPQGVPRLALRRTPPNELVIAPYATALAAQIMPMEAIDNFEALQSLGTRQQLGFIEALDYTPSRQVGEEAFTSVETFMAHHQGMTIVAIANVLMNGVAQRWGAANAHIEAVSSLLHERAPRELSTLNEPPSGPRQQVMQRRRRLRLLRDVIPGATSPEPTHVMSNGRYSVTLRANGAGWSRWGPSGVTRWRDDALRDSYGSFFYLRRVIHGQSDALPVSITQHPAPDAAASYKSIFHSDRVCFDANWKDLQAHTTVWVSPEDDIEFRKVELHNMSDHAVEIELISAFDVTLTDPRADEAHPAFTNLFVRAHWDGEQQALKFIRKPRLPSEPSLCAAHFLAEANPQDEVRGQAEVLSVRVQTDRQLWLGRNHAASQPLANMEPLPTSQQATTLDTGLNPICALSVRVRIAAQGKAQLTFATTASDNQGTLHAVIDKYHQPSNIKRASLMSATLAGIRLHALRISGDNFIAIQTLTTALVLSLTHAQARMVRPEGAALEVCDRRLLWRLGISGDRPLLVVTATSTQGLGLLRSMAQGLRLWTWGSIQCDLVVINAEPASYLMELQREILALRERHLVDSSAQPGAASTGFHILRAEELSLDELSTLQCLARVQFNADGRPLAHHVQEWSDLHAHAAVRRHAQAGKRVPLATGARTAAIATRGQFDASGGDFTFDVDARQRPQRPWINVLANADFGAQISETGGGYTWAQNSRMNQLTAWSNDPVADPPSEWFLLQDTKTLETWSVTPNAWGCESSPYNVTYQVVHGQGVTTFRHQRGDLAVTASWCVDADSAVKQVRLTLTNHGPRHQRLRVIGMVEWMMGANRVDKRTVYTRKVHEELTGDGDRLTALLCTQTERSAGFGNGTAFFALTIPGDSPENWTCDRRELFDDSGFLVVPNQFAQAQGEALDPCAALSNAFRLEAGETLERVFLLGYAESPKAAQALAAQAALATADARLAKVTDTWNQLLGQVSVKTPDPLLDAMVNRWLLYQTLSCRLWAKAGFYQAGGATGFRDQLQDTMALAWVAPHMLRAQIALCASRQFEPGDVQHWWHAPTGAGVRTHFSDDLLWLPYATAHYLRTTGDATLLDEAIPFLEGQSIPEGVEDAYFTPGTSTQTASVFEHCARAIDRSLRVGAHGLPLMGSGDWNDGMNRVGIEGRGESVWLGWFLCTVVASLAPLARERGELARAQAWETAAQGWTQALLGAAWDGEWFKRAFFDNGEPLGSNSNAEGRIDLIAQAWAVLSGVPSQAMQRTALASMEAWLLDPQVNLIRLLDPPLVNAVPSAGYIQAYPPGVRENGGQYSHGAVWAMMAQAELARQPGGTQDDKDKVWRSFTWLSPAHRAHDPQHGPAYGLEPYAMAGDVYTQPPYVGRGGWSWYTGAAAWMHRAAIESIFGLQLGPAELSFNPCLPAHWPQAELTLKRGPKTLRFILMRGDTATVLAATVKWDARWLAVGQTLRWVDGPDSSCHVVALSDENSEEKAPQVPVAIQ